MIQQKSYTVDEVLRLMEHYCTYQDRCHLEVEQKLAAYNMIPQAKEKIIIHLITQNYLNEERFATSFAHGKFYIKHWGKIKITAALTQRKISAINIATALKTIDPDDYIRVLYSELNKKKAVLNEKNPYKLKKKVVDYLLQKGFEYPLIEQEWSKQ